MANYSFIVDSSFSPFSLQEMLVPYSAYKDAFEKSEEVYNELSDKTLPFEYLSRELPEDSKARQIYEGYANTLKDQATDLATNGLTLNNRQALSHLRRRFSGEIGRLIEARDALKEEKKLRRELKAKDASMLFADDNLNIDSFLDDKSPNLYGISGNELYAKAAAAGKAASMRVFSAGDAGSTLGGYYRDYVEKMGYTKEQLDKFGAEIAADFAAKVSTLPELQEMANQILDANGVNGNLTGANLRMAQQQVVRGIIDGAVYQESHKPVRDEGVMSAAEVAADSRARASLDLQREEFDFRKEARNIDLAKEGYTYDRTNGLTYNKDNDQTLQRQKQWISEGMTKEDKKDEHAGQQRFTPIKGLVKYGVDGNEYNIASQKAGDSEQNKGKPIKNIEAVKAKLNTLGFNAPAGAEYYNWFEDASGNIIREGSGKQIWIDKPNQSAPKTAPKKSPESGGGSDGDETQV